MTTTTPVQPESSTDHDFGRRSGVVLLMAATTAMAYAGTQFHTHEPLLFVPFLTALLGLFLPRGNTVRTVLFSIAAVGCLVFAMVIGFIIFMLFSGGLEMG